MAYEDKHPLVRTLIPDTDQVFGENEDQYMLEDEQIENFLAVANGNVLRAAAYAVYAISTSEALISKVIKTQDLSTDGAKVADALTKKGDALMARADKEQQDEDFAFFQIIDYPPYGIYPPELTERPEWV